MPTSPVQADQVHVLQPVLRHFADLDDGNGAVAAHTLATRPVSGGLINATYALGNQFILQHLHRIFAPEVNADIAALTPILRAAGVPVPAILPSRGGQPWVYIDDAEHPLHGAWRILTRLAGHTRHQLANPAQAQAAGAMVGRFHSALLGCDHPFAFTRPGAHDTAQHMAKLLKNVSELSQHRLHDQVAPLADQVLQRWARWGSVPSLPSRLIHGDLKVSNLLFDGDTVCGVIDLDTMARGSLDMELGDAMRSWCNATTEDDPAPCFVVDTFAGAMRGYLPVTDSWLSAAERQTIAKGTERICLELAARFLTDALLENYFGFDPVRYPTRGEHNLVRGRNQLLLAADVALKLPQLQAIIH